MNKNTRYEIRLSVQLKNEFTSCGGNAKIVRTLMMDYIKVENDRVRTEENNYAVWNLSNMSVPNKTVRTVNKSVHHQPLTHDVIIIRKKNNKIVRTYNKGQIVTNKYYDKRAYQIQQGSLWLS